MEPTASRLCTQYNTNGRLKRLAPLYTNKLSTDVLIPACTSKGGSHPSQQVRHSNELEVGGFSVPSFDSVSEAGSAGRRASLLSRWMQGTECGERQVRPRFDLLQMNQVKPTSLPAIGRHLVSIVHEPSAKVQSRSKIPPFPPAGQMYRPVWTRPNFPCVQSEQLPFFGPRDSG